MSGSEPTSGWDGESAVAELRRRLRRAEEEIRVPPGLWERVREPRDGQVASRPRRRWVVPVAIAAATVVVAMSFAAGVLWQRHVSSRVAPYPSPIPSVTASGPVTAAPGLITGSGVAPAASVPATANSGPALGPGLVPGPVLVSVVPGLVVPLGATCDPDISSDDPVTCVSVVNHGLDVDTVEGAASADEDVRMQMCLYGPNNVSNCSTWQAITARHALVLRWSPHSREPAGRYCAIIFRIDDSGAMHTAKACYDVEP